jgi:bifunctional oligoribonuclease and PAP phosphatase NrnA
MLITLPEALRELKQADSFLITTHANPDGDAIGSMLGLHHFLTDLGKTDITSCSHDAVPKLFSWLPLADSIVSPVEMRDSYDLLVIIDVAQRGRIGNVSEGIADSQRILVLDHHLEKTPCGTVNFMDHTLASASEIVALLYKEANIEISPSAAECTYVGLATDTGGFRYANTNERAHAHAQIMVSKGINVSEINSRVFDDISLKTLALTKIVLNALVVSTCGRFTYSTLTLDDMNSVNATPEDLDGLVNYTRNIEGVVVGALFREIPNDKTKVSMRSKTDFNSNECLNGFGGGGHAGAAGATINQPLALCREAVLNAMVAQLGE